MARLHAKYRRDDKGRKVLQVYQAKFYNAHRHPKQKRISLGTRDKSAALQGLAEMDRKYMARLFDPWTDRVRQEGMFVGEGIKAFLKSREGRSPKTIKGYTDILRLFRESLPGGLSLQALASRHVETFLAGCNLNAHGRCTYVRHLGVFFRWCLKEGTMYQDPTPQRERNSRREKRTVHAFLSEAEVEELLRVIEADAMLKHAITDGNRWLTDVIRFAVGTGLRRGEVCNLRWSAADLKGQMLTVKNTENFATKSGHERPVPLVGDALAVLVQRHEERITEADDYVFQGMRGKQLNAEHLSKRFRFYRRLARLPKGIKFHSLRHTFASWWVMRGGDIYRLKEVLGHADIQTTMIYAHLRPDALRQEMEKCFGAGWISSNGISRQEENTRLHKAEIVA